MVAHILVVEDESGIRNLIGDTLSEQGFRVTPARSAAVARATLEQSTPDLAIIDWMMPQVSGLDFIRQLRRQELTRDLPVILLTARATEDDTIQGLDAGADDYITKPFSTRELVSRVNALLRRSAGHSKPELLAHGKLTLNNQTHRVKIDGTTVALGQTEFRLLAFFLRYPDRVFSRAQLLDNVWGQNHFIEERTVDVHILRLRKALREHLADDVIDTVRGAGYRLTAL
ncbi:phosphate regulon transcriptional regulatory protein PhoB [Chromatiales bacterium (ex Bugula neritina AB1)]|nr:phosphate regulon transcriptional regulatory protein PhoB [Chromatiales bacterium (ex Bugula neritina AB1)]